jgi:endonuclease/exonuclease/phosphatase family metal-dependent hydrolase
MRAVTLNLWGYNDPYDYTLNRNITRGAVPGSEAAKAPAASWLIRRQLVADLLAEIQPDLVGLQEVALNPAVEEGVDSASQLAGLLGWNVLVAPGHGQEGTSHNGLALISPHTIRPLAEIALPDGRGQDTYRCLACEVTKSEGAFVCLVAHFALAEETTRAHQVESARRILDFCKTLPAGHPVVLLGDLNAEPHREPIQVLIGQDARSGARSVFRNASNSDLATMPSHDPSVTLDYILVRNLRPKVAWTAGSPNADGYFPSDHLALVADLDSDVT